MTKRFRASLFLPFLLLACGLPKIDNIPTPSVISSGDNRSVQIMLPSSYMNSVSNFQGISFFYKIYPADSRFYTSWSAYTSFQDAYSGDYDRISLSFTAESTLRSYGYLAFNREEREESPLPILGISSADQGRNLVATLDFQDITDSTPPANENRSAKVILTENNQAVAGYPDFDLFRQAIDTNLSEYKTLGYLTYYRLEDQKTDNDLRHLPANFLNGSGEKFYIVLYGVVYGGDIFDPVRSQAFRLGYMGTLNSGSQ